MDDKELAEKVEAFKEAHPRTEGVSYDDLLSIPQDKWGEYDVGMVRIVQAEGVEPCELCAPLIGKCFTLTDGRFYLEHGRKNHRTPFCLGMVPAFRVKHGSNCTLPEYPAEGVPEAPGIRYSISGLKMFMNGTISLRHKSSQQGMTLKVSS